MTLLTRLGRDLPESAKCALAKSPPSVDVVLRLGLSILSRVVNAVVPYFRWTQYRCSAPTKQNVSIVRCHWNGHPCGGSPCSWVGINTFRAIGQPAKVNLDQLRRQARDVARDGADSRALLPLPMMAKEAQKQDMEKLFDKALKQPDCKEVYSDLGLLVVVPLLRDAAKGSGCKW